MSKYRIDREFSERYVEAVKWFAGPHLLKPAPIEMDIKQATDMVMLRAEPITIGVRIRRPGYVLNYAFDFTIRSRRENGAQTELSKVLSGWMTWMFYGHAAEQGDNLERWMIIDMNVFRREAARYSFDGLIARQMVERNNNRDGTRFVSCDVRAWPSDIIVASSHEVKPYTFIQHGVPHLN